MPGKQGRSKRIERWANLLCEPREALIGRVIAADMVNDMLLDIVHRLYPSLAADEKFKAEFAEADDQLMVDSLTDFDNGILAAYSDSMTEFEKNLFSEEDEWRLG